MLLQTPVVQHSGLRAVVAAAAIVVGIAAEMEMRIPPLVVALAAAIVADVAIAVAAYFDLALAVEHLVADLGGRCSRYFRLQSALHSLQCLWHSRPYLSTMAD